MPATAPLRSIWCTRFELLVVCLIAAVVVFQLVLPPVIGIADNGDFARVMGLFGLGYLPGQEVEAEYFVSKYQFDPDAFWQNGFVTSESLLVGIAIALNRLISVRGLFDIRVLGLVQTAVLLVAVWLLLVCSRRLGRFARGVFIVLLVVAVTDVGYVQWFNSFYSETASYLFFLLGAAFAWRLIQHQGGIPLLLLWALAAVLLVAAKPQNAPLGLALAVFGFHLRALKTGRVWSRCCAGVALAILVWSGVYYKIGPYLEMREMAQYYAVFYGVLVESPNPAQDLADLGLSPDLARFALRNPYTPDSGVEQPSFRREFFARMTDAKIAKFYATHPARLVALLEQSARQTFLFRPDGLSNFEREAGRPPYEQSHAFELWSRLHAHVYPRRFALLVLAFGLSGAALVFVRRKQPGVAGRLHADFIALLLVMALVEFVVVTMMMGTGEPIKHMFLVDVLIDASLLAAAAWGAGRLAAVREFAARRTLLVP